MYMKYSNQSLFTQLSLHSLTLTFVFSSTYITEPKS